jgi:hypothetical protein
MIGTKVEEEKTVYVYRKTVVRSRNVYTSSAVLRAYCHFSVNYVADKSEIFRRVRKIAKDDEKSRKTAISVRACYRSDSLPLC